jgi:hypothetical protein
MCVRAGVLWRGVAAPLASSRAVARRLLPCRRASVVCGLPHTPTWPARTNACGLPHTATDAAGLADVPEGSRLELELTLSALRPVTHPAPGVTKKVMAETEGSYSRPNAGSSVRVTLGAASADGATVYEAPHEAEFVTDDEQVRVEVATALLAREGWARARVGRLQAAGRHLLCGAMRLTPGARHPFPHTCAHTHTHTHHHHHHRQAPEGVELALATMREGERALVTVSDAGLTAPPAGAVIGGGVPAGVSPVVYDITLTSFSKAKERWEMNNQEKVRRQGFWKREQKHRHCARVTAV